MCKLLSVCCHVTRFLSENHGKSVVQLGHVTARARRNVNSCRYRGQVFVDYGTVSSRNLIRRWVF